ncbi:TPA: hypothetical protein ACG31P_000678 [Escherichia coli]
MHVFDGGVSQIQRLSFLIALLLVFGGVVAVVVNGPGHGNQQADNDSADDCG